MLIIRVPVFAIAAAIGLAGCASVDDHGDSGSYEGISLGPPGGGDGGLSQGSYFGWYDNFYYPGVGTYVFDRGGRRFNWNADQRRYWEARRDGREARANWDSFRQDRRLEERRQLRRMDRSGRRN